MLRAIYLMLVLALFLPLMVLTLAVPQQQRYLLQRFLTRGLARIFHLKIKVTGQAVKEGPVLFVSNHISYADIVVLGAVLPAKFVSKAEVGNWPLLGHIAKVTGTLFIDRKKSAAGNHLNQIEEALFKNNKSLIIFPEGTTGDGRAVLPFKSSLFKIAENLPEGKKLTIQPVTLEYTHINGLPLQANERKRVAWIGDAEFGSHFREFVNLGMIRAQVTIHAPITNYTDRKSLAAEAQKIVGAALNN